LLERLDERGFASPALARATVDEVVGLGGLLTVDDLTGYRVEEREPLAVSYRGMTVLTNPPPSFGGALIALGLQRLEATGAARPWNGAEHARTLIATMIDIDAARVAGDATARLRQSSGTTHISVSDAEGNVAAMTTSNGEGSGIVAPGTGVLLNNMLGEDDLHPAGFHAVPAGERVSSMMAPTVVVDAEGAAVLAAGSGGSARIRTALLQVIAAAVDEPATPLADLIERPRLHWDGATVQLEPGLPAATVDALAAHWPVNAWTERNLYFGGVHAVRPGREAAGDPRRGGAIHLLA
jgi:gamma-glutamyltranspeptidase/glutathione hydrolase